MDSNVCGKKTEYLAKAAEAEELAAKASNAVLRESWLSLAQSYRDMARNAGDANDANGLP